MIKYTKTVPLPTPGPINSTSIDANWPVIFTSFLEVLTEAGYTTSNPLQRTVSSNLLLSCEVDELDCALVICANKASTSWPTYISATNRADASTLSSLSGSKTGTPTASYNALSFAQNAIVSVYTYDDITDGIVVAIDPIGLAVNSSTTLAYFLHKVVYVTGESYLCCGSYGYLTSAIHYDVRVSPPSASVVRLSAVPSTHALTSPTLINLDANQLICKKPLVDVSGVAWCPNISSITQNKIAAANTYINEYLIGGELALISYGSSNVSLMAI